MIVARPARLLVFIALIAASLVTSGYGPPTLAESDPATTPVSPSVLRQINADRVPGTVAKAAVVMDATTGQIVYDQSGSERRAPASTTKIMTALVTLENARLDEVVTAGPSVRKVEPSVIGLDPGDKLTVEQLLYGLLLPSGNDAAVALAEHVGGSIPKFVGMMNAKAAQLSLANTHFVNPHGLDEDGHYSSARDLAILARAAMKNPTFEKIVSTKEYRIPGPPLWVFKNSNRLLGLQPGADGVKTGYTDDAGRCLVYSATRDGHRVITVVLDSGAYLQDSAALADYFFANYGWETLDFSGVPLGSVGDEPRRTAARTLPTIVLPKWQRPYFRWFFAPSEVQSPEGAAGTASYYYFGRKLGQVVLYDAGP